MFFLPHTDGTSNAVAKEVKKRRLSRRTFIKYSTGAIGVTGFSSLLAVNVANGFGHLGSSGVAVTSPKGGDDGPGNHPVSPFGDDGPGN